MRKVFFQTLEEIAKKNQDIFLLVADLGVKFFQNFRNIDPSRFINVGVAEANMIGIAAGLSMSGKNVYCYSIIPFLLMRTFEQIRNDLCYNNLPVKLLGAGGGLVYGVEGFTHHAIEDVAIMRSLPNMTVVAPGDALEAKALAEKSVDYQRPLYIRFGRDLEPLVHQKKLELEIGKGIIVREGKDICLLATGTMLYPGKIVTENLEKRGFNPTLISLHTIKPLDKDLIKDCARKYKFIFTLEEHNIIGGLGSAVAEVLAENNFSGRFRRIGIRDEYSPYIGGPAYLLEKLGLDSENLTNFILKEVQKI
jgi:transketolase